MPSVDQALCIAEKGYYPTFQLPAVSMLPWVAVRGGGRVRMKRLNTIRMDEFHERFPMALLMIDIPYWLGKWCQHVAMDGK